VGKPVARLKRIGSVQFMRVELLIENYYCVNLVKRMGFFYLVFCRRTASAQFNLIYFQVRLGFAHQCFVSFS